MTTEEGGNEPPSFAMLQYEERILPYEERSARDEERIIFFGEGKIFFREGISPYEERISRDVERIFFFEERIISTELILFCSNLLSDAVECLTHKAVVCHFG